MDSLDKQFSKGKPYNSMQRLSEIKADRTPGFWVMISIFLATFILATIGMVV